MTFGFLVGMLCAVAYVAYGLYLIVDLARAKGEHEAALERAMLDSHNRHRHRPRPEPLRPKPLDRDEWLNATFSREERDAWAEVGQVPEPIMQHWYSISEPHCADCGMSDEPRNGLGLCSVCAELAEMRR